MRLSPKLSLNELKKPCTKIKSAHVRSHLKIPSLEIAALQAKLQQGVIADQHRAKQLHVVASDIRSLA